MENLAVIANELIPIYENENAERIVDARELHSFLKVGKDFSNWMKDRIVKYGFIKGFDFSPILAKSTGGRPATEYHLTVNCAKEIAMVENNRLGKQIRKYFIEVENRFKQQVMNVRSLPPELQFMQKTLESLTNMHVELQGVRDNVSQLRDKTEKVEERFNNVKAALTKRDENWRQQITDSINLIVKKSGRAYGIVRMESYARLRADQHCNLNTKLKHMKERKIKQGLSVSSVNSLNYMDVIENDKKLKSALSYVVKEMVAEYA